MDYNASKSRLTGAISGKLSTAASEILADVEVTFVLYEAEVSGLRQEIDRLKSQLELFQPRVKEEPTDDQMLFSLCGADGGDGWRDDAGQTCEIKSENPQTLKIVSYTGGLTEDQHIDRPGSDEASRLTDGINMAASHIRNLENYMDLKICILTDWTIQEVSDQVDDQYPVHELQCRSGQQEADFLKLLRSTFPVLAPSTPFESFITDPTNRLQPLEVQAFTPEQICRAAGNSALYIRLKCPVEQEAGSGQQPMQTSDDDEDAPPMELQTAPDTNRNETLQENPVKNQSHHNEDIVLKVRVIEDSRIEALSKTSKHLLMLKKYKSKKLRCPCGMQEAEFLKLLKSKFPQLAAGTPFEYLITNNTKKLLPLKVKSLTPEQISSAAGNSALYIRLKSVERNIDSSLKDLLAEAPRKKKKSEKKRKLKEPDTHISLRIHILDDSSIKLVTSEVRRKCCQNKLQCPRGMKEADFLNLLRSTFPQLTLFESFKCDRNRKLLPLQLPSFTPELIRKAAGTSALYLRLQRPEKPDDRTEETRQNNQDGEHPPPHPATPSNRNENPNPAEYEDTHINLKVFYLEESQMDLFSSSFSPQLLFQKFPVHVLTCPRGLPQSDLLAFLRSTFSQLASDQPFSVFALQGQKMLQLNLSSVNPEEIRATIDSLEASVICVQQLKDLPQKEADESKDPRPRTPQASIQEPSRTNSDPDDLVELKICIVADPMIDVASPLVLQKYPVLEFQCPGTLQEAQFLSLLRTTFPQLAGEALDFLTGHGGDVKPINLQNLTSDDISRTLRSAGGSLLYVRLKEQRNVQTGMKRSRSDVSPTSKNEKKLRKRLKRQSSTAASSEDDETEDSEDDGDQNNVKVTKVLGLEPKRSADSNPVEKTDKHPDPTPNSQTDDERTDDSEDENYYKNPLVCKLSLALLQPGTSGQSSEQDMKTEPADPTGQKDSGEAANSQVDDDETEDSEDYDERESIKSSRLSTFHPARPENEMKQNTSKNQVKKKKKEKKKKEKKQKEKGKKKEVKPAAGSTNFRTEEVEIVDSEDEDDKNTESTTVTSLLPQTSGKDSKRQTGAGKTAKRKKAKHPPNKETNCKKEEMEIINIEDDDGDEASSLPQVFGQDPEQQKTRTADGNEVERSAVNMEPVEIVDSDDGDGDKDSTSLWTSEASGPSAANTNSSLPPSNPVHKTLHRCEICQTVHQSKRILIRHVWTHVNNQDFLCGVCRQRFDCTASLKIHLQTHEKTYTCKVCGKSFLSKTGLKGHMVRHKGGAPEQT
ncbi:uncharacterized protein LOC111610998 isoform X1 [Xiphophorus maculatus]|uniref:uncharacterized protein LOC111610998 isoform X1 n=1 Tax=Xiphophorus maculatus TaxID=8083 RepID=UPI000C6C8DF9|nr:uncharacterized protein LOC111610998 isoform X1 [Xiphophorus maculatus]